MSTHQTNEKANFTLVHEFNAPRELVFNAFSNAEALNAWWGPVGTRNIVVSLDFRPGGIFHYKMEAKVNSSYGRFVFGKINPHDLLEFTTSFADENAHIVRAPFDIIFPAEVFYQLRFTENNGKTTITLTVQPVDASPEETTGFHSIDADMQKGFGATFDKLSDYLDKQTSAR